MDKWIAAIEELFSFLADVLTVWFVVRSLSGLTFRQIMSRLVARETTPPSVRINTVIAPQTGILSFIGGSPRLSCQVRATLAS